ncbi:hypothetical protein ACNF42_07290 [Cuniculiplasma sp. SKW3]|uniref:hypothetical protein n=1 Tax=Cuniculiplasma sp. SKW3 TaxID=3400170 RepID=UPI003FD58F41
MITVKSIKSRLSKFFNSIRKKSALSVLGISMSSITKSLSKIFLNFLSSVVSDISILFSQAFGGFGNAIVQMFQVFGASMGPYGPLAPTVFVGGLLLAVVVGYVEFDIIDAEKDVTGFENDL